MAAPPPPADPLAAWPCLSRHGSACMLQVNVAPNARRTAVEGLHDGALRIRLAAPPIEGKANDALVAWLAAALGLPRRGVRLRHGQASRRKLIEIDADADAVAAWLSRQAGPP
jgi:uncharacterized protein (TIGR00251 family)